MDLSIIQTLYKRNVSPREFSRSISPYVIPLPRHFSPKGLQKSKKLSNKNISYHLLQHLVQVALIYLALLNPWLIL